MLCSYPRFGGHPNSYVRAKLQHTVDDAVTQGSAGLLVERPARRGTPNGSKTMLLQRRRCEFRIARLERMKPPRASYEIATATELRAKSG